MERNVEKYRPRNWSLIIGRGFNSYIQYGTLRPCIALNSKLIKCMHREGKINHFRIHMYLFSGFLVLFANKLCT